MTTAVEVPMFELTDFYEPPNIDRWPFRVPPRFSLDYFPAEELIEAHGYAREVLRQIPDKHPDRLGARNMVTRLWEPDHQTPRCADANGHTLTLFRSAICSCSCVTSSADCQCVIAGGDNGGYLLMVQCDSCQWRSVQRNESAAIAAWHDHAWPGWRALPIVPAYVKRSGRNFSIANELTDWVTEHYPESWKAAPNAPIITQRAGRGTRSVPGRSPWGGYDLSRSILTAVIL